MPLTAAQAKNAQPKEKDYKLYDERGLFLLVKTTGAKYWRLKYRIDGKEKLLALGVFPEVTLAMARDKRDSARVMVKEKSIDPSGQRKATKQATKNAALNSFEVVALEWTEKRGKKSASGDARLHRVLEKDLFPHIGREPVAGITPPQLLAVLRKIEARGAVDTSHRAKQIASQIFRYAVSTGRAERDPSADLKGALTTNKHKHLAAVTTPLEAGRLYSNILRYQGTPTVVAALKLSALFFCRQGELRHMTWDEINWDKKQIEIAADRTKIKAPHIIPLSKQALETLTELSQTYRRGNYVFPSARGLSSPLSENACRVALRTMGYDNDAMTPHGFRAMARTLLDEELGYRIEWIEQQLGHAVKDVHGRAYNRTTHLEQRREMMQRWADYLDQLALEAEGGNVVQGNFKKAQRSDV